MFFVAQEVAPNQLHRLSIVARTADVGNVTRARIHVQVQKHAGPSPNCNDIDYQTIIRFARYLSNEKENTGLGC